MSEADLARPRLAEFDEISLLEVDDCGRWLRSEIFAADRLGDAVARLYERYAELLPDGPERERAAATARSVAAMASQPDHAAPRSRVRARHRGRGPSGARDLVGSRRRGGAPTLRVPPRRRGRSRPARSTTCSRRPDALLVERAHTGIAKQGGGAYERRFLMLLGSDAEGRIARIEWFETSAKPRRSRASTS